MKAIKILSFVIIGILVVGIGIGAYIYFYTDTFKTNKEIFYKYATEEQLSKIIDFDSMKQTLTRFASEKSEQNIDATINITMNDQNVLNNATVVLNGKNDPIGNKAEISLFFGNNNKKDILEIDGIYNKDKFGISFKDITQKYITIQNQNLNSFSEKLDLNEENIDKIELSNYSSQIDESIEEVKTVCTEFFTKVAEQTSKEQYSNLGKTQIELNGSSVEAKKYELKLNSEEIKQICDSINIDNSDISEVIKSIKNSKFDFTQTIYVYEEKLIKIEITINGEDYQARITKNIGTQNDNLTIQITTSEEMKVIIDILKTSNEKYVMSYEVTGSGDTENKLLVNVNMDIKFNVDNTVEELTDENSVIINDMSIEEIEKIKETVVMLVKEKEGIEDTIIGFFQSIMQIKDEATSEAESAIEERASQESIGNVNIRPY
mgnify:CR=1 FL=1